MLRKKKMKKVNELFAKTAFYKSSNIYHQTLISHSPPSFFAGISPENQAPGNSGLTVAPKVSNFVICLLCEGLASQRYLVLGHTSTTFTTPPSSIGFSVCLTVAAPSSIAGGLIYCCRRAPIFFICWRRLSQWLLRCLLMPHTTSTRRCSILRHDPKEKWQPSEADASRGSFDATAKPNGHHESTLRLYSQGHKRSLLRALTTVSKFGSGGFGGDRFTLALPVQDMCHPFSPSQQWCCSWRCSHHYFRRRHQHHHTLLLSPCDRTLLLFFF
ncbi:hypothetical protein PIB30_008611 [Stylosanthes scabra]|uniref:Uncharacterized protein n=1 Tax=Stylosanthes scabra TaxID=79078 RepID=A0ABU6R5E0_9FABA|nr:hypothetical protein [Stylosanthes scabra]